MGEPDKKKKEDPKEPEQKPGVPPEHNDDYKDNQEDFESAESFPASDPPANY